MMRGSGLNIGRLCDECGSEGHILRYAGALAQCADELDQAVGLHLDRADAAALDAPWRALLTARCPRCGSDLTQSLEVEEPAINLLAESDGSDRFPELDVLDPDFLAAADQQTLLGALLEAAVNHSPADTANAQLVEPDRNRLYIAAHQGFERTFLDFFAWVEDDGSACAAAATQGTTVIVPDVARSPLFTDASRQAMLDARSYAVQSIPLISSTRQLIGVFSCHYHQPGPPSDDAAPLLDALAKAAAWSLQRQARQNGNGSRVTSETDRSRADG